MKKIKMLKSSDADTRTSTGQITKDSLLNNTLSHISNVQDVGFWLAEKLKEQVMNHDHTKIDDIDGFYEDFTSGKQGKEFKELPWWQLHKTERHHLNDSVPKDVNLLDVMEMVIDCTVAGLCRSGSVYDITIPQNVLQQAIDNTKNLIIANTEVVEQPVTIENINNLNKEPEDIGFDSMLLDEE